MIDARQDCGDRKDVLKLLAGEVAHSYTLCKSKSLAFLHLRPDCFIIHWQEIIFFNGELVLPRFRTNRPMNQVKIKIVQLKVSAITNIHYQVKQETKLPSQRQ